MFLMLCKPSLSTVPTPSVTGTIEANSPFENESVSLLFEAIISFIKKLFFSFMTTIQIAATVSPCGIELSIQFFMFDCDVNFERIQISLN